MLPSSIVVLGAGAFGTALARVMAQAWPECTVVLWNRSSHVLQSLGQGEHPRLGPVKDLPHNVVFETDFSAALEQSSWIVLAVALSAWPCLPKTVWSNRHHVIVAAKGMIASLFPTEWIEDQWPQVKVSVMGGPHLAKELTESSYSVGMSLATRDDALDHMFQNCPPFMTQRTTDLLGLQFWGAIKNVAAMIASYVREVTQSANTTASVMARLWNEAWVLSEKLGCQRDTAFSYAGFGDWFLTCHSPQSRHTQLGKFLAQGSQSFAQFPQTADGPLTLQALCDRIDRHEQIIPSFSAFLTRLHAYTDPKALCHRLLTA